MSDLGDRLYQHLHDEVRELKARIATLESERDALICLFSTYGNHEDDCPALTQRSGKACVCGFDEVRFPENWTPFLAARDRRMRNEALEEAAVTCETFGGLDGTHLAASAIRAMKEPA